MEERKNPFQWLINIISVTEGLLRNTPRIWELARFEFALQYRGSYLGMVWAILSPLTQIGIYWFVFGIGLRQGSDVDGIPFVVWLVCGYTAWNYASRAVTSGAGELRSKLGLISKVSIPPYLILASRELSFVMSHLMDMLIMFLIMLGNHCMPDWHALNLVYYVFAALCFGVATSTVFSTLALIASDFQRFLASAMRLMFFLSPIFWRPGRNLPGWAWKVLVFNPFAYLINGYRGSLLYHENFWANPRETAIFWGIVICFYAFGCQLQSRVHDELADYV